MFIFLFNHSLADYNFVSTQDIKTQIDAGNFIEHAEFSGNFYGTRFIR